MSEDSITKGILKSRSGEFDLESIHSISLKNLDLTDLGCIGECLGLQYVDLSYNNFSRLHQLAGLENLQHLNLSANRISSIEGLQSLNNLEKLNLAGNLIGGIDVLHCISGLEKLTSLRLCDKTRGLSNPACMNSSYVPHVISMFPNLMTLDGERIKGRGSEVFKMFKEIDEAIADRQNIGDDRDLKTVEWVPEDYWEPSRTFEQTVLGDAQQQLEDLLSSCTRLSGQADEKLLKLKMGT